MTRFFLLREAAFEQDRSNGIRPLIASATDLLSLTKSAKLHNPGHIVLDKFFDCSSSVLIHSRTTLISVCIMYKEFTTSQADNMDTLQNYLPQLQSLDD